MKADVADFVRRQLGHKAKDLGLFELALTHSSVAGPNSYERLMHDTGVARFYLDLGLAAVRRALREPRLERAIGVIYRPETERQSHYFNARLADQFDALIHIDETSAVRPLEDAAVAEEEELPETFPSAL